MDENDTGVLQPQDKEQHRYVLITGANSGLGFGICCRLIDEFVKHRPPYECLTLVITTRDERKSAGTLCRLERHRDRHAKELGTPLKHRIFLQPERVDLASLQSIQNMSTRLIGNLPHLDTIICNAAYGNVIGVDWAKAIWETVTDLFTSVTYPTFKLTTVGETTAPQSNSNKSLDDGGKSLGGDPPLGKVFTSNVFGHYILSHSLIPLLTASPDHGRIIFVSSIEPLKSDFNPADIQALSSPRAYESSKRLTDILALTSNLPSTKPFVRRFLTSSPSTTPRSIPILDKDGQSDTGPDTPPTRITMSDNEYRPPSTVYPNIYLTHPGIIATAIVALSLFPFYARILVFYIARWLGSPWHPVTPYKGACAPVWLALADKAGLEELELRDGKGKWGSVCSRMGHEKVMRTEVEGWGLGGRRGEGDLSKRWGKRKGIEQATEEDRLQFEELGRDCWRQMEELRAQWEERTRG